MSCNTQFAVYVDVQDLHPEAQAAITPDIVGQLRMMGLRGDQAPEDPVGDHELMGYRVVTDTGVPYVILYHTHTDAIEDGDYIRMDMAVQQAVAALQIPAEKIRIVAGFAEWW